MPAGSSITSRAALAVRMSVDHALASARHLLWLGDRAGAGVYRDDLVGRAVLHLRRPDAVDGGRSGLVACRNDRRVLAGAAAGGAGRTAVRALARPARRAHADDARVVPCDGTGVCLGARCRSVHVLPDLGRAGPGDGSGAVRAVVRSCDGLVRPPAGACDVDRDLRRRLRERDLHSAGELPGANAGLAHGADAAGAHSWRRNHPAACSAAAPAAPGFRPAARWRLGSGAG